MKHRSIRVRFGPWGMVLFAVAAMLLGVQTGGCSNPIVLPKVASLSASDYKPGEYPFKVTINAYQDMRFNVHTFEFGSEKVPVVFYFYLKRNSGVLSGGDFLAGDDVTLRPTAQRGTVSIQADRMTVDIDMPTKYENGAPSGWAKSFLNGTYQLVRE